LTDALSAHALVERFCSPLYVYDAGIIRERWRQLRHALPDACDIHYAVKANPSLGILALLRSLGAGAEVASRGELLAARRAGFAPENILWAGPGKTPLEHETAAIFDIAAIHAESDAEIRRLDALGRRMGRRINAGVRVHVPFSAGESTRIIGGASATKFGVPEQDALDLAREWAALPGLLLRSVHVFNASNVLDASALVASAARTLALAADLAERGLPVEFVDLGGGLGVPMLPNEQPLDVAALGRGLAQALDNARRERGFAPRLVIEPGRFLVAESGRYLMRVIDVKSHAGVEFLVCDGGIQHLLRPALVGQAHPVQAMSGRQGPLRSRRVVGPLCTSLDDLGGHDLPDVEPGDVLAVTCAGAYGFTESMPLFLSHARPAEILLMDGAAHVLRTRVEPEKWLEDQSIPDALVAARAPR
jgi:diaminopimelate decarboxylase